MLAAGPEHDVVIELSARGLPLSSFNLNLLLLRQHSLSLARPWKLEPLGSKGPSRPSHPFRKSG